MCVVKETRVCERVDKFKCERDKNKRNSCMLERGKKYIRERTKTCVNLLHTINFNFTINNHAYSLIISYICTITDMHMHCYSKCDSNNECTLH